MNKNDEYVLLFNDTVPVFLRPKFEDKYLGKHFFENINGLSECAELSQEYIPGDKHGIVTCQESYAFKKSDAININTYHMSKDETIFVCGYDIFWSQYYDMWEEFDSIDKAKEYMFKLCTDKPIYVFSKKKNILPIIEDDM